ncbi:hypothetical protein CW304_17215 [Bacillus sp. UFRGS-B20]|nr:hypothetical protein CW304_17215 [Bacillus sp. UFRGS-B20]
MHENLFRIPLVFCYVISSFVHLKKTFVYTGFHFKPCLQIFVVFLEFLRHILESRCGTFDSLFSFTTKTIHLSISL